MGTSTTSTLNDRCLTPDVLAYLERLYGLAACAQKLLGGSETPTPEKVIQVRAQYEVFMSLKLRAAAYEAKQKTGSLQTDVAIGS